MPAAQSPVPEAPTADLTRNDRLDRLPVTRKHVRLMVGSGIGWALDAMDVGLISFIMAALAAEWHLDKTQTSWLGSVGFIGMALGATLGGLLADKLGRRHVFAITLLVYGLATGASALSTGLVMLMALRFVVGLGLGAELPVASTLVSEFSPLRVRGRMVVLLEAFWAVGWIAAACIGTFIVARGENGWRWALALGCIPVVYAVVVRMGLPESVRFLESKGRHAEAERIVRDFEAAAGEDAHAPASAARSTPLAAASPKAEAPQPAAATRADATPHDVATKPEALFSPRLRRRTIALWAIWFCINLSYYGAFIWIPSLLVDHGFPLAKSFEFTLIITLAQIPGYFTAAYLIERWGRRRTLAAFLIGSAIGAVCFGLASEDWAIIAAGCVLSFFNLGAWGALYAIGPELYPTPVRGRGTGAAAGFGRIASIIAPLIVPPILLAGGPVVLFAVFATAFVIAAVAAFLLPEKAGERLTE